MEEEMNVQEGLFIISTISTILFLLFLLFYLLCISTYSYAYTHQYMHRESEKVYSKLCGIVA